MRNVTTHLLLAVFSALVWPVTGANLTMDGETTVTQRPRARDLGIEIGIFPTGEKNGITDVAGVRVGHTTLIEGESIRTGVTAIVPHKGNIFREKVPAAIYVGNGFGKLIGSTQVEELGELETPILLTATLNAFRAADALIDYTLAQPGNEKLRSVNPIVGETNDGRLNDIRGRHVTREHCLTAIENATDEAVEEGAVGAGTGTIAFDFKGGIGTASRKLPSSLGGHTLGVLVQSNFGGVLTIAGKPVGKKLGRYHFRREVEAVDRQSSGPETGDGSIMMVVATDAPVDARNLRRIAARAFLGMGRTGGPATNGSGDYVIAFTTAYRAGTMPTEPFVPNDDMSPLFQAAVEATEEAIYNSMLKATTISGNGMIVEALPLERLKKILTEE